MLFRSSVSEDVLQSNPATLDDNETKTKGWYPSAASEQTVRSIYLIQKRTVRVPWMETFDQPENTVSCARREVSIVPSQALALLNSDWVAESATRLATRIRDVGEREDVSEREGVSDRQASIIALYRATLGRAPTNRELERCSEFLDEGQSLAELILVLLNSNELAFIP